MIGNVDSGKSTMVGVMTKSIMDDGRGSARQKVFNFSHEAANGRTSSIGQEIMGFDDQDNQVQMEHLNSNKNQSWAHVAQNSQRLVTFLDLCGHEKYLKTTMFGLVGLMPDYSMIVVGANMGVSKMTREHLGISLALGVPLFIVITKIDLAPDEKYQETLSVLTKILKSPQAGKNPITIPRGEEGENTDMSVYARAMPDKVVCPIFSVSNVNGEGINTLKKFMSLLKSRVSISGQFGMKTDPVEFLIDGFYQVRGVGPVVAGTLLAGTVNPGATLLLGPNKQGQFDPVQVKGIHHKRVDVEEAVAGQAVCFAIKTQAKKEQLKRNNFRKGMVMVDREAQPQPIYDFEAEVVILHHATSIRPNYQAVVHCGVIRQAAKVVELDNEYLRSQDKGTIRFRFMYRPEFVKEGTTILFREGRTKGLGVITRVFLPKSTVNNKKANAAAAHQNR